MKIRNKIIVGLILLIILIGLFFINRSTTYKNNLSKSDTFDRFITLVENGEYEEAKKLTDKNFTTSLSTIKDIGFSKMKKNYELSNETKFVYIKTITIGYYEMTTTYYFELENTRNGWKIAKFYDDITDNERELNSLTD